VVEVLEATAVKTKETILAELDTLVQARGLKLVLEPSVVPSGLRGWWGWAFTARKSPPDELPGAEMWMFKLDRLDSWVLDTRELYPIGLLESLLAIAKEGE
jgi:hypothetical protein